MRKFQVRWWTKLPGFDKLEKHAHERGSVVEAGMLCIHCIMGKPTIPLVSTRPGDECGISIRYSRNGTFGYSRVDIRGE